MWIYFCEFIGITDRNSLKILDNIAISVFTNSFLCAEAVAATQAVVNCIKTRETCLFRDLNKLLYYTEKFKTLTSARHRSCVVTAGSQTNSYLKTGSSSKNMIALNSSMLACRYYVAARAGKLQVAHEALICHWLTSLKKTDGSLRKVLVVSV